MNNLIERLRAYIAQREKIRDGGITITECNGVPLTVTDLHEAADALEAAREDAERWRHARKLLTIDDIEGAQGAYESFGRLISEDECKRADAAIDAARGADNG